MERLTTLTVEVRLEGEACDLDRLQDEARACLVCAVGAGRFLSSRGGTFEFCEVFEEEKGPAPDLGAQLFELGAAVGRSVALEAELARLRWVEEAAREVVARWERGDLAGAVCSLAAALEG